MKILQTCGSHSWGGLEMETLKISAALADNGAEVTLLCPHDSTLYEQAQKQGITVIPMFNKNVFILNNILTLKKLLKKSEFDIIHTQLSHDLWTMVPAMKLAATKSKFFMSKHVASRLRKKDIFHKFLYGQLDGIITISNFIRKNVIETCPIDPKKVETIYNGIPDEFMDTGNLDKNKLRNEFNIDSKTVIVGLVGRLTLMKGHIEFLRAARMILDKGIINVIFMAIGGASFGEEDFEKEVLDLARELKLGEYFIYTGFRSDIQDCMASFDILAFPSHKESFGNTLVEGMLCGLPVVASNSGAVPEIVIENETGYLVPPKDPAGLSEKMEKMINAPHIRAKFGETGRKVAKEKFLFSGYISALEKKYSD